MKSTFSHRLSLAVGTLLLTSVSANVTASDADGRIESAAKMSYGFKTYSEHDAIEQSLVAKLASDITGGGGVKNNMTIGVPAAQA